MPGAKAGQRGVTASGRFGSISRRRKLGEIVAERIVDEIIQRGWNEGEILGTEADFMERYRISRATFREAARQLEWQGAGEMRRGASGGLAVKAPPRETIVKALRTFFQLAKIGREQLSDATAVLSQAPRPLSGAAERNEAIALFLEALASAFQGKNGRLAGGSQPKLSESVALRLLQDLEQAAASIGTVLGNEAELQQRYGVSRAIMREALRLLELHNLVRVKTGANGGVIAQAFDPEYTVGLVSLYLVHARIPLAHLWEAQSGLEIAAVRRFVGGADKAALRDLARALTRLEQAPASHYLLSASQFHRIIADGSGNPAIALFVAALLRYSLSALPRPDDRFLPWLKAQHRDLLQAATAGDAATATARMAAMFDHSRQWIERLERSKRSPRPSG
jgi:DNA-binding FadR family transcriptional regulator